MRTLTMLALAFCSLVGACAESPASPLANAGSAVPMGTPDNAPASFTETCVRSPRLCDLASAPQPKAGEDGLGAADPVTLAVTTPRRTGLSNPPPATMAFDQKDAAAPRQAEVRADFDDRAALRLLQTVNNAVNGVMARDMGLLVNPANDWTPASRTPNGLVGDCKSFAAEKRRRLILAGFPADRLFYAVVFREDIGLHALLMAHLDSGDYALDSRQPWVTPWYQAAYTYVQRQVLGDQMQWSNLIARPAAGAPMLLAQTRMPAGASAAGSR